MTDVMRITDPADLLTFVPHVLGFHPDRSIAVIALVPHGNGFRLGVVARVDMPEPHETMPLAHDLVRVLLADGAAAAVLVGYEDVAGQAGDAVRNIAAVCARAGLTVETTLFVHQGRYRTTNCADAPTYPLPSMSPVAVRMIVDGSAPAATRDSLAARLRPGPAARPVEDSCSNLLKDPARLDPAAGMSVWASALLAEDPVESLPRLDLAQALLCLEVGPSAPSLRDALLVTLCPGIAPLDQMDPDSLGLVRECLAVPWRDGGKPNAEDAARLLDRFMRLCSSVPDSHAAPAMTLLATFAWWTGDGALAHMALDRALACEPGYRLALLLRDMVSIGLRLPSNA